MSTDPTNGPQPPKPVAPEPADSRHESPGTVNSRDLLQGGRELLIDHAGEIYRLRLTRNGKLILHK
jgi:hemin uptake protein HemP